MLDQAGIQDVVGRWGRDLLVVISRLLYQVRTVTEVSFPLFRGELEAVSTLIFTMKESSILTLREITLCNTTAGPLTFYMSVTDPGQAEAVSRRYYNAYPVAANETITLEHRMLLISQERIYAWASGAGLNCRISALEVTSL
jgi:hypothetical protein